MQNNPKQIKLFNVPLNILSYNSAEKLLLEFANSRNKYIVFTPNVHHVYLVNKSKAFNNAYKDCSLSLIDGIPIIWALKCFYGICTEKISGSDMFVSLYKHGYDHNLKIFLLGGMPGVAKIAAENLREGSTKSNLVVWLSPKQGFENIPKENAEIIQKINEFKPNILFVALGSPKGELWIHRNFKQLNANITMGVGGSIDFAAGVQKRAPQWIQRIGLEWFYRLCCNPRRLFHRYLTSNSFFIAMVVKELINKVLRFTFMKR